MYVVCDNIRAYLSVSYRYIQGVPKKLHKVYALQLCNRTSQSVAKCSERTCLQDKGQCLNIAVKYSLFCSSQVNCLKIKLTAKSLRQIFNISKVCGKPIFHCHALNSAIIFSVNSLGFFNSQSFN